MLVVVDLGNSSLKFGAFENGRLIASERVEGGRGLARGVIPFAYVAGADEVVVGTSAPDQLPALLARLGRPVRVLGEEIQRAVASPYEDPTELGIDRIAAAFGARDLSGGAAVVVDAGTAITVDGIRADGTLVPVAIAAGALAAARGLKHDAPHLPWPALADGAVTVPATGTAASLRAGFVLGMAGLVDRLVETVSEALGGTHDVVLTGGHSECLSAHVRRGHRVQPLAVLYGLRVLHERFPER